MPLRTEYLRYDEQHVRRAAGLQGLRLAELLGERTRPLVRIHPACDILRRNVAAAREPRIDLDEFVRFILTERLLEVFHHDIPVEILEALDADNDDLLLAREYLGAGKGMRREAGRLQRADSRRHHHLAVQGTVIGDVVLPCDTREEIHSLLERFRTDFFVRMRCGQVLDGRERVLDGLVVLIEAEHIDYAAVECERALTVSQERDGLAAFRARERCDETGKTAADNDYI